MSKYFPPVQGRRELLRKAARYVTLAALGATGVFLSAKRRFLGQEGTCKNHGLCSDCGLLQECDLPQARSAKLVLSRIDDGRK